MESDKAKIEKYKDIIKWAKKQLPEDVIVSKEAHGDRSDVFKLSGENNDYFLKIGSGFTNEYERLLWLRDKLPVPKVIAYKKIESFEALLLSGLKGRNLKLLSKEWPAEKVVDELAKAIKKFHATDISNCPFGILKSGEVLIHGDASLPNFIFEDNKLSGYIDLGEVRIGDREIDFAAAIWSLQYNLGKGWGKMFLEKYGINDVNEEHVEKLRLKYEEMQKEWGFSL